MATEAQISLNEALGISNNTDPAETNRRWLEWKNKYPTAYAAIILTPAAIQLNSVEAAITAYETAVTIYNSAKSTWATAQTAYKASIAALALINPAAVPESIRIIAEEAYTGAVDTVKGAATSIQSTVKNAIQQTFNTTVPASTALNE